MNYVQSVQILVKDKTVFLEKLTNLEVIQYEINTDRNPCTFMIVK